MPISHKIRQYRALLRFAHPGEILWSTEWGQGSCTQAGNMAGFYAPNSGWLPLGARDWSPRTKRQSIIGGSPRAQVARRISPPILTIILSETSESQRNKSIETESRMMDARGGEEGRMGVLVQWGQSFGLGR